jgi:hypothetical protein
MAQAIEATVAASEYSKLLNQQNLLFSLFFCDHRETAFPVMKQEV